MIISLSYAFHIRIMLKSLWFIFDYKYMLKNHIFFDLLKITKLRKIYTKLKKAKKAGKKLHSYFLYKSEVF